MGAWTVKAETFTLVEMDLLLVLGAIVSALIVGLTMRKTSPKLCNLTARAEAIRGAPKALPAGHDGQTRWEVAQSQCKFEAEFATFVVLLGNHLGPVRTKEEAYRRGLAATLVWHGEDPENPPTAELFDALHKEDAAAP